MGLKGVLQSGMEDAKIKFADKSDFLDSGRYPSLFVGMLVVSNCTSMDMSESKTEAAEKSCAEATPPWAIELGLDGEHCGCVRSYFGKRSSEMPGWLEEDAAIWKQLEDARAYDEERRQAVDSYAHSVALEKDGKPASVVRATPGEAVELHAKGWIQNKGGDTSSQQLLLVLDRTIIADIYDSIPGAGDTIDTTFSFQAPEEPGAYMIWRFHQVEQSTSHDATAHRHVFAFVSTKNWLFFLMFLVAVSVPRYRECKEKFCIV